MSERLRDRLVTDLRLAGKAPRTCEAYACCVRKFAEFIDVPPRRATRAHIAAFVDHVVHVRRLTPSTVKTYVYGIRFFYEQTLKLPALVEGLKAPKVTQRVPKVLSGEEVMRLIESFDSLTHYTIASLLYATGVRLGEALNVVFDDIDAKRGVIVIPRTKTRRPRVVRLSDELLARLRHYWRMKRPPGSWLFPASSPIVTSTRPSCRRRSSRRPSPRESVRTRRRT